MSGEIFKSPESFEDFDASRWNPLHCYLCKEQYEDPCILACYHSFCGKCLLTTISHGSVSCPLCGTVSPIKEGSTLPDSDPLLKFLVESSSEERVECANCDTASSQMFFCTTCNQPLCPTCREETHRAKMFARHELVTVSKRSKEIRRECKIHNEPFILFSTEKKLMLCINCFRDMKVESRSHCVDLETAYKQGCQKLDNAMQSIRDLQHSVRDAILLLRALLEEVQTNSEQEKEDISNLFDTMQEKISETKQLLLEEVENQYEEKEKLFKNQLVNLSTFLPTLHIHLVTCGAFSSSANKFEFLDFTYVLMERLKAILQVQHPLHPSQGSDIVTDYKAMFAKCLEPLLFPHRNGGSMTVPSSIASTAAMTLLEVSPAINATSDSAQRSTSVVYTQAQLGARRYNAQKLKLFESTGFFADHCKEFDDMHRELMLKVEKMKLQVQELQRDLTLRRCLAKNVAVSDLKSTITEVEVNLEIHHQSVQQKQTGLEKHWEEALERLAGEQEIYKAQLQDVMRLKQETQSVKNILERLSSFVSSIANVTARIAPKLSKACGNVEHEHQHQALLQEINTMQPDSQQRVDAIRTAQEERETKTANRTNPLDEELIKTKGLLRAPSARKDNPCKRDSRELKEIIAGIEELDFSTEGDSRGERKHRSCDTDSSKSADGDSAKVTPDQSPQKPQTVPSSVVTDSLPETGETVPNSGGPLSPVSSGKQGPSAPPLKSPNKACSPAAPRVTSPETALESHDPHPAQEMQSKSTNTDKCGKSDSKGEVTHTVPVSPTKTFGGVNAPDIMIDHVADVDSKSATSKGTESPELTAEFTISIDDDLSDDAETEGGSAKSGNKCDINDRSQRDLVHGSKDRKQAELVCDGKEKCHKEQTGDSKDKNQIKHVCDSNDGSQTEHVTSASADALTAADTGTLKLTEGEDDELYVPKSLPELTQVFEPSEKPLRRKRRGKSESESSKIS